MGVVGCLIFTGCGKSTSFSRNNHLALNDSNYFETRGLNFFVFSNLYDATFDDSKISAVEIIHHGIRTATNGDVRMNPTPGQWDKLPKFVERMPDKEHNRIDVILEYPEYNFEYKLTGEAREGGFYLSVNVDKPLPEALHGIAGLNMEFMPPVFFGHSYIIDGKHGLFPTSPADFMTTINGEVEPTPMANGKLIDIAPDEPLKHITIRTTDDNNLSLFDGRNKQQNGNFVVRTLLPAGKTGKIAEWFITAETQSDWVRKPVVSYSQVGYHPTQKKVAVVELDKNDKPLSTVSLYKVCSDGSLSKALSGTPKTWGMYTRYNYLQFDFSSITEPGIYMLEYGDQRTAPFPIATDVFQKAWFPTLDVFFPVQMDHMFVRETYRVWHGAAHLDDALAGAGDVGVFLAELAVREHLHVVFAAGQFLQELLLVVAHAGQDFFDMGVRLRRDAEENMLNGEVLVFHLLGAVFRLQQGLLEVRGNINLVCLAAGARHTRNPGQRIIQRRTESIHADAAPGQQLRDERLRIFRQGEQHMLLTHLHVLIFHRDLLGALESFHRFLGELVRVHNQTSFRGFDFL